jgi:DNA polymerase-3 subunit beta
MDFTCLQVDLKRGLDIVGRAIEKKPFLPITKNVMIEAKEDTIRLSSTNTVRSIIYDIRAVVQNPGSFTLPARILNDVVTYFPNLPVNIISDHRQAIIKCEKQTVWLPGLDSQDFPKVTSVKANIEFMIPSPDFKKCADYVVFSADSGSSVISGISMKCHDKIIEIASTDKFRLSVYKLQSDCDKDFEVIIPASIMEDLSKISLDEFVLVKIDTCNHLISIKSGSTELVSSCLQGRYPDYNKFIPDSYTSIIEFDRVELLRAIKAASAFSQQYGNVAIKMIWENKQCKIMSESLSLFSSSLGNVVEGEGRVAFNEHIIEILDIIKEPKIKMFMNTSSSPITIKIIDNDNYIQVMMPLVVNW